MPTLEELRERLRAGQPPVDWPSEWWHDDRGDLVFEIMGIRVSVPRGEVYDKCMNDKTLDRDKRCVRLQRIISKNMAMTGGGHLSIGAKVKIARAARKFMEEDGWWEEDRASVSVVDVAQLSAIPNPHPGMKAWVHGARAIYVYETVKGWWREWEVRGATFKGKQCWAFTLGEESSFITKKSVGKLVHAYDAAKMGGNELAFKVLEHWKGFGLTKCERENLTEVCEIFAREQRANPG